MFLVKVINFATLFSQKIGFLEKKHADHIGHWVGRGGDDGEIGIDEKTGDEGDVMHGEWPLKPFKS